MNRPENSERIRPVRLYLWVLAALLALLTLSAGTSLIKLGPFNTILNLGISGLKTLLVMAVFMHETGARRLTQVTSALGFIWLLILISLALVDFVSRTPVPIPWK